MAAILRSKWSWAGLAIAGAILLTGVFLRPYWRDEYWALYFSAPHLSLHDAVTQRMVRDVHPPLYFILQHYWRLGIEAEWWARLFNVLTLVLGAFGVWRLGRNRPQETLLFLLLCGGSYWVIYYTVELRMYLMLFVLCAMSVIVVRNALEEGARVLPHAALFALIGAAAGATQFFGALWIAVTGAWTGLALLRAGRIDGFFAWGVATAVALAPAVGWIAVVGPQNNPGAEAGVQSFASAFAYAANQFLRGLIVKTLGSNLAAAGVLVVMAAALVRRRSAFDVVMALSFLSAVVIAFVLHFTFVPALIKERAFIVVMPAVIYLVVRAIGLAEEGGAAPRLRLAIPIMAAISPVLFLGEYTKDREHWGEARALIREAGQACAGAQVVAFNRVSEQAADFHPYVTRMALRDAAAGGSDLEIIDADDIIAGHAARPPPSSCPVKAVAIGLGRGDAALQAEARARLAAAGVPLDRLAERMFGGGRTVVYEAIDSASYP